MTHIHEIGKLVHRDLKPENVLMCGNADLKITDLGIAKAIDALSESSEGRQTGDPRYMAPEQFHSESSALSDIYTFGVVFYEMLTGRRPSLLRDMSLPERPDQINREVPPELSEIVLRCLARNPRERYGSFFAIKDDISKVLKVHFPGALSRPTVEPTNMWEIMLFQEREYRALTKDRGPDPYTNYLLGHSLACVGQYGDALKYVERMAHPDDGSSEAGRSLVLAGNCLNALGEFRPALRAFEDSLVTTVFGDRQQNSYIQLKPGQTIEGPNRGRDLPFVWAGMAYSWLRLGNRKQALECLRRGASLDQLRAETWPTIWNPLVDSPEFEQAIRRDLKEVPELRMLWFEVKASVLLALGRCDEAIRSYTVVLGVNSRHSRAWMRLADARLGTGDQAGADEAVAAAKKAGERPPIRPVLYTGLAGLLQKVWGRLALKAYDCALSIDPRCSGAWNNKGYFLKRLGMHEQAIHCYRQAVASDPLNWVAWGNLGSVLGIVGRYRESLECSKRSLGINPFNDSAIANKRHALLLLGPQP
jgi:tetratricopeptide (TPR) repeat protein